MEGRPSVCRTRRAILPLVADGLTIERDGRRLVDGVSLVLHAEPGVTVLLGPNGAGKSLLLQLLTGLLLPDAGTIAWAGQPHSPAIARRIGFVFQKPVLLRRTVLANVAFSLAATGCPKPQVAGRAQEALRAAGLAELADQPARSLSGGEQQRLALARALSYEPELLVLDEPAAHLDPASVVHIESLVHQAAANGTSVLLVTHDIAQAQRLAYTTIFMHRGRILETGSARTFFDNPKTAQARAYLAGQLLV
jgi:tungstate transport system ATP-binding protein